MMPVLFIGHGSPMNALEENEYAQGWREIAAGMEKPSAILSVSAHWYTDHTGVSTAGNQRVIHDFYGFPKALYAIQYPAQGSPHIAGRALELLGGKAAEDNTWGLDHGTWCPLLFMYPDADIPVFQLSINKYAPPEEHLALGRALEPLRRENVLIMGSGNIVHNLTLVDMNKPGGFDWAYSFDDFILSAIENRSMENAIHWERAGESAKRAFPAPDHYYPLLYVLGAAGGYTKIQTFNHTCTAGSLSMTSYLLQ